MKIILFWLSRDEFKPVTHLLGANKLSAVMCLTHRLTETQLCVYDWLFMSTGKQLIRRISSAERREVGNYLADQRRFPYFVNIYIYNYNNNNRDNNDNNNNNNNNDKK